MAEEFKSVDGVAVPLTPEDVAWIEAIRFAPPIPAVKTWTPLQFMEEFTTEERIALRTFAKSDVLAEDWLDLLKAANEVRMDDPRTRAGLDYMVSKGVLSQARIEEILS
jgi:hypothetical protein